MAITTANIALLLFFCLKQPFDQLSVLLIMIINEVGITFLSIFFSFFTSMGITVRVKLKMSWIIITVLFILVFLNIAFVINEVIRSVMNSKKTQRDIDPEIKGTEEAELDLKGGRISPPLDEDDLGRKISKKNPKKSMKGKREAPQFTDKPSSKEQSGRPNSSSTDKHTAGRPSSNDDGAYIPAENPTKKPKKEAKKKDIRKTGHGKDTIQNQIDMRRQGINL